MTLYRSKAYERIHDETWEQFRPNEEELKERSNDRYWLKTVAPKWVSRVGMPRLIAEAVLAELHGLVRSINPGLFRNDPRGRMLIIAAKEDIGDLYQHVAQENWRRFNVKEKRGA